MNNKEKYIAAFIEALKIDPSDVASAAYMTTPSWDSVAHMALTAALEDAFDIMLDTEDILELSSFQKGMEILGKYDIQF